MAQPGRKVGAYRFEIGAPEQIALARDMIEQSSIRAHEAYLKMLDAGIAREVAEEMEHHFAKQMPITHSVWRDAAQA